jgi:putative oxidoreductase
MSKKSFVLFRALTSSIFIYAGMNHLFHPEKILNKVAKSRIFETLDSPTLFAASIQVSGIAMAIAGVLLLAGIKQRVAAILLLSILISITLMVQLENLNDLGPFFKNVAIAGSLLFIINYKSNESKKSVSHTHIPIH